MRIFAALAFLMLAGCASGPRLRTFTTDGCSLFPNGTEDHKDLWLQCCVEHDYRYWMGGTKAERLKADTNLRSCVEGVGQPKTAKWMLAGVRVGGTPYLPVRFRFTETNGDFVDAQLQSSQALSDVKLP